jgi:F-type H+-transporting ATPase subunit delta
MVQGTGGKSAGNPPFRGILQVASDLALASGLAGRYATALYELADQARALDAVSADLARIRSLIAENRDLAHLVSSPLIARDRQAKAMAAVIAQCGVHDLTRRFVGTVARNRRLFQLTAIIAAFQRLLADRRGEVTAEIASAVALSPAQLEALTGRLRAAIGRKVAIEAKVEPALLGGLRVRVGSRLIDASLSAKLQRMQLAMKGLS